MEAVTRNSAKSRKPARRTNEERSAETRRKLIDAVISSLCALGYAKTTTQVICGRAQITTGAMQHHFGSKDELVLATLDILFSEIREHLEAVAASYRDLAMEQRCHRIVEEFWDAYYGRDRYMAVWEIVVGSRGEQGLHDRVVEHRIASLKTLQTIWRGAFGSGDDKRIADALNYTLSTLRGFALYGLVDDDAGSVRRQLKILGDTLFRLLSEPEDA